MTEEAPQLKTDVVVIGGALTGMTIACALAARHLPVTVIEKRPAADIASAKSDGRTSAISHGSKEILAKYGLWDMLAPEAGPIFDIRVSDADSSLFVHYDHELVSDEPMGYIVENHFFLQKLYEKAATLPHLKIIAPAAFTSIERDAQHAVITLDNGQTVQSSLVIAADGRPSKVRETAGIKTYSWSYHQTAIVCNIRHEKSHQGIALERFLPAGPFASLPMHDPYLSSLVWTEKDALAPLYLAMEEEEFLFEIQKRLGSCWGNISLASARFNYPLSLIHAKQYTAERLALAGDAAHGIHPIAGQGFNLGIRDIEVLADLLIYQHELGLDVGTPDVLAQYARSRHWDNFSMVAVTDGLNRLFSNSILPFKVSRRLGLGAVNKTLPLKRFFMKQAMGE